MKQQFEIKLKIKSNRSLPNKEMKELLSFKEKNKKLKGVSQKMWRFFKKVSIKRVKLREKFLKGLLMRK
jgi:hypothetical protein